MKKILFLASLLCLFSCVKEGEIVTTTGVVPVELSGSGDVVIDKDNPSGLALTLYWTDNSKLSSSNEEEYPLPEGATLNTLQFSSADTFDSPIEVLAESSETSMQFTGEALNTLVGRAGLPGDVASTLYIRMKSVLANNLAPAYSNVYSIKVTPYTLDMSTGFILDSSKTDTGNTLYSPDSDGIYYGFMGASGWYNWYLLEGNGLCWGNDGVTGTPFMMSTDTDTQWNFWFPGSAGCYYTIVNTITEEWSALYIPSLTVSGDLSGEMTFDRKSCKWTLPVNISAAGSFTITISGSGKQYNVSTGADNEPADNTPVAFASEGGRIVFTSTASDITVSASSAGESTLTLDLSDPTEFKCGISEGSEAPVEVAKILYVLGNDDTWNYDQYLTLYDEDNLCYAAAVNFNCSWGYYFSKEYQDWIHINQDPSTTEWKLASGGTDDNNIPAPGTGLYVTVASLGWMSYWYGLSDPITSVYYAGFNDDWSTVAMTPDPSTPGVYTAEVTATADTPWGAQVLVNGSWDYWFGTCADGSLIWSKKQDGAPAGWEIGKTFIFTADLCKCTYTLTEK